MGGRLRLRRPDAWPQLDRRVPFCLDPAEAVREVWQWNGPPTSLSRLQAEAGTVGEYNGKFMCGQFVLKGASCATRAAQPSQLPQFFRRRALAIYGVRLAQDA